MNFFSSIITDLRDKIIIHIDDLDLISPFFIYYFLSIVFVSLLIKELMGYHVCSNWLIGMQDLAEGMCLYWFLTLGACDQPTNIRHVGVSLM